MKTGSEKRRSSPFLFGAVALWRFGHLDYQNHSLTVFTIRRAPIHRSDRGPLSSRTTASMPGRIHGAG